MPMKRQNFYVSEEQIARMHAMAAQHHISLGELMRRLIDQGLARLGMPSELGEHAALADVYQQIDELRTAIRALEARLP